ncbi:tryptophan synthase beta subunit-like PLP-dependent enzyme [Lipomyces japonicus]|uniref:tryptophan synthase beta subunit-like PLP-dependent enzyme n=1 Tax=Lipomyces japonicus TaxID=56871 RepID=UPI0034CE818F
MTINSSRAAGVVLPVAIGFGIGVLLTITTSYGYSIYKQHHHDDDNGTGHGKRQKITLADNTVASSSDGRDIRIGVEGLIGRTPIMKIKSLSQATGCEILAKVEMMNPGGSAKDRIALAIVEQAEAEGLLRPNSNDIVFEGTSGSTGISLAMICRAKGYRAHIFLPDDTSTEKIELLEKLGAVVEKVPPASIVDKNQYTNAARARAEQIMSHHEDNDDDDDDKNKQAIFADQFENEANWQAHFDHTGPEIYAQLGDSLHAFVTGAGTGGTISGVSRFLKPLLPNLKVVLADPPGSGLFNKVKYGVMFDLREREGTRRRHQVDTLIEGIGINRLTNNFDVGRSLIDDAVRVTDKQSLAMARYLVERDGLFVGSSTAVNCVAAATVAKQLGPGHTILTVACDSGARHLSKFWKAVGPIGGELSHESLDQILNQRD